jgi:hypothetical protein
MFAKLLLFRFVKLFKKLLDVIETGAVNAMYFDEFLALFD